MNSAATQFQKASQTLDSVFLALGLASNLFVCFIMIRCKLTKKSISNFYVFQLSVAEVVYRTALAVLEIYFLNRNNHHLISDAECKVIIFWRQAFCAAVFILLVGIATDRKEHIINSIKAMTMVNTERQGLLLFGCLRSFYQFLCYWALLSARDWRCLGDKISMKNLYLFAFYHVAGFQAWYQLLSTSCSLFLFP